jgi:hypothetical protein
LRERAAGGNLPSVEKIFAYGFYTGAPVRGGGVMPAPDLRVPLDAIRREAELARDASSLRAVAREVGITPMGLRAFLLNEGKPQARTARKLNQWYARRMATRLPDGEDEARAALTILAGYFPERARRARLMDLLDSMERGFRDEGMQAPAWLDVLRREVQAGAD